MPPCLIAQHAQGVSYAGVYDGRTSSAFPRSDGILQIIGQSKNNTPVTME